MARLSPYFIAAAGLVLSIFAAAATAAHGRVITTLAAWLEASNHMQDHNNPIKSVAHASCSAQKDVVFH
jgi:hypothetical protein